jgi:YD repeat-containing protein
LVGGTTAAATTADADIWNPNLQVSNPLNATLQTPRASHMATLLADGRVLISGGYKSDGTPVSSSEVFDPETGQFLPTPNPPTDPPALYMTSASPANAATEVPVDTTIAVRFSQRLNLRVVSGQSVTLTGPDGDVAAAPIAAEGGRLLFIRAADSLQAASTYHLTLAHLESVVGQAIAPAVLSFTTADKQPDPTAQADDEIWTPNDLRGWHTNAPPSPWQSLRPLAAPPGITALAGQVLKLDGTPLADVTLSVGGLETRSDNTGRFLLPLPGVAAGRHVLAINGASASRPGRTYGFFEFGEIIATGQTTALPFTVWMPRLDTAHTVRIPSPTTAETVITTPFIPGLELHLPVGTVIKGDDGQIVHELGITPIPVDRPPFPLAKNVDVPIYFTIQPGSAYLYSANSAGPRGAQLVYPNYHHIATGVRLSFWHYDPNSLDWYVYGWGTVRGTQVFPNPTTRLYEFTGAMIDGTPGPPLTAPTPGGPNGGDPVDLATGIFVLDKTDLLLPDVIPIQVRRTYRPGDSAGHSFGVGAEQRYDLRLWSAHNYTEADLVLPDGSLIHYVRTSPGTGYLDAIYQHSATPTRFFASTIAWNGNGWDLTLTDGTVYVFGDHAPLQAIRDRYGNIVTVSHSNAQTGNVTRVTSPNGRWIAFTYDSTFPVNRVTQATDNIGRTVLYTYDANGNLSTVTDPESNVTTYTWDTSNRLVSVKDGRNIIWLTNQYDTSNRVTQQTLADPSATYGFSYTTDGNGNITQTDVTDPRGYVERLSFDGAHYVVSGTRAYGTSLQRTTTLTRQASGDFITEVVDPLNRVTDYTYDTSGHVLTRTRLAGTSNAVTTTYSYEQKFFQLASVTDPLNHTWSLSYDTTGRLTSVTDPLSHQRTIALNSAGLATQITDPLQHVWQLGYTTGDLTSLTDPQGSVWSQFVDAAGRTISSSDPLGRSSRTAFDKLNRVTSITDPLGGVTNFTYDANSNLLSVSDALAHATAFTYDSSDRVASWTDPLSHATTFSYDLNDQLNQVTDRKSQVTAYGYDALNRLTAVTFNDSTTITYTYDAGDRVTQIVDSANGTISREFDGLNRVTEEITPEGTVDYVYDADGFRTSMTVAGQAAVTYAYDDAHRLTSITKGAAVASLTYDAANRRSTLTYPNGIVATYTYDAANHLTDICFTLGQTSIGEMTYAYDAAGNRTTLSGSWARSALPSALTSATYDAGNRITTWGACRLPTT